MRRAADEGAPNDRANPAPYCNRVFDFVSGAEIVLPRPGDDLPEWDIVRPNPAAAALLAEHQRLIEQRVSRNRRPDPLAH